MGQLTVFIAATYHEAAPSPEEASSSRLAASLGALVGREDISGVHHMEGEHHVIDSMCSCA